MLPLKPAAQTPDAQRGAAIFTQWCARCHGPNGQGDPRTPPGIGYAIPPLWGPNSFNAAAGMANATMAAAFIRANMPLGVDYRAPILTEQQAWDLAAFITSRPRPGPRAGALIYFGSASSRATQFSKPGFAAGKSSSTLGSWPGMMCSGDAARRLIVL